MVDKNGIQCYYNIMSNVIDFNKRFYKLRALSEHARDPKNDVKYDKISHKRTITKCCLDGCNNLLTHYKGPGSMTLCREHQLLLREYGGHGRMDRKYTFWKKDYCEDCGRHPITDNKQIRKLKEPIRTIVGMMMLSVDHIEAGDRSSDKYTNSNNINHKDNCKTVCDECHKLKTYLTGDHWSNSFHGEK